MSLPKPYYQDSAVTLYHGDCREIVPLLGRFDLVWTDPPYNVGKEYGAHDDDMPMHDYLEWCDLWLAMTECASDRIAIYPPKIHLRWFLNRLPENHLVIASWNQYGACWGDYVHQYAPLLLPRKIPNRTQDHWGNMLMPGSGVFFREHTYGHPGYTSEGLTRRVIDACSNKGERVLDIFGGTGTSGRVCKDRGRKCVMIEREERYCKIAARRMGQEVLALGGVA